MFGLWVSDREIEAFLRSVLATEECGDDWAIGDQTIMDLLLWARKRRNRPMVNLILRGEAEVVVYDDGSFAFCLATGKAEGVGE